MKKKLEQILGTMVVPSKSRNHVVIDNEDVEEAFFALVKEFGPPDKGMSIFEHDFNWNNLSYEKDGCSHLILGKDDGCLVRVDFF